jgi:hypothetical protein
MHPRPKSMAFLATAVLWFGTLSAVQAQEIGSDEAGSPEQEAEAAVQEETPTEQEEAVETDDTEEEAAQAGDEAATTSDDEYEYEEALEVEEEGGEEEEVEPGRGDGEVGLELGFYYRSDQLGTALDLSPLLSAWYAINDDLDITLDWGFAFDSYSPEQGDSASNFVLGNPFLSVRKVMQEGRTRIWFGIGANVPVSSVPNEDDDGYLDQVAAYLAASAMRGNWNQWLWMPEHFGIVVPLGARMVSEEHMLVGGETAFYFLIPLDNYRADRSDFYIQLAGDLGFGWERIATGLRLQGVVKTTDVGDRLQSAIGPFVRYDAGGGYFTACFLVNLDEPAGIFGEQDVWGLHLGGGAGL